MAASGGGDVGSDGEREGERIGRGLEVVAAAPEVAMGSRERESRAVGDDEAESLHWRRRRRAVEQMLVGWSPRGESNSSICFVWEA